MGKIEKIRIICSTVNGNRFVVGESEKNVHIWDITKGFINSLVTDLNSDTDSPISLSENGAQMAVAGYDKNTVTLYNIKKKSILWQRKDFKNPLNVIILDRYNNLIFLETENHGSFFIDRKTGEPIESLKDVEFVKENPYSTMDLFRKKSISIVINRTNRKEVNRFRHSSFAMLDSCFTSDKIICSYSGNPLLAISLTSFQTLWTTRVVGHFLEIEYCEQLNKILGIRWEYEKGSPKYLSYINVETGEIEKEIDIGNPIAINFLKKGGFILTSQGKLYSAESGQIINQFDFDEGH